MQPLPHRYAVTAFASDTGTVTVTAAELPDIQTAPPTEFDGPGDLWSPEALLLAARCQHILRWTIPRDRYPMNKSGYKQWRKTLARFHAEEAGRILHEIGYQQNLLDRVAEFLQKFQFKLDPEVQLFEDAICLVFLENEFSDFARQHDEEKLLTILEKTWKKMSPQGHQPALELARQLPEEARAVVQKAVGG